MRVNSSASFLVRRFASSFGDQIKRKTGSTAPSEGRNAKKRRRRHSPRTSGGGNPARLRTMIGPAARGRHLARAGRELRSASLRSKKLKKHQGRKSAQIMQIYLAKLSLMVKMISVSGKHVWHCGQTKMASPKGSSINLH